MMGVTPQQGRLLKAVVVSSSNGRLTLTLPALAEKIGLKPSSRGHVHAMLKCLHERGFLSRDRQGLWQLTSDAYSATLPADVERGPDILIDGKRHLSLVFGGDA
jgi:DNA-binding IclR family transcriptional regulator